MKQEDIIRMAREAGLIVDANQSGFGSVEAFAALVRADEREACAKLANEYIEGCEGTNLGVGKAIRARSEVFTPPRSDRT